MSITQKLSKRGAILAASLVLGAAFTASSLSAQSVSTTPVGAVTTTVKANSDERAGIVLQRPSLYSSKVTSVSSGTITVTGSIPSLGSETKYVKITSGAQAGQWFTLTASTGTTLKVAENLSTLGVVANDTFEVRPFWTLATLLPAGGGLPVSTDPFSPASFVFFNDPSAVGINLSAPTSYFYYSGDPDNAAGWLNSDGYVPAGDAIINPDVSIIFRNGTSQNKSFVTVGEVPVVKTGITVVAKAASSQDNVIYNPYPAPLVLKNAGFLSSNAVRPSSDPFSPTDQLFVYNVGATGVNGAAAKVYFYYAGDPDNAAGWVDVDGYVDASNATIPSGAAFIIRKGSGSNSVVEWTPPLPYSL
jgi:uncharacterized protein (TIGR02597 family)